MFKILLNPIPGIPGSTLHLIWGTTTAKYRKNVLFTFYRIPKKGFRFLRVLNKPKLGKTQKDFPS